MNKVNNLIRRTRMYSGLLIFAYVTVHLFNHSLGLISLEVMENAREYISAFNKNLLVSIALYGALLVHAVLGLQHLFIRRSFKMTKTEWVQLTTSLIIPGPLLGHMVLGGYAARFENVDATYAFTIVPTYLLEPASLIVGSLFLIFVWVHGVIGITSIVQFSSTFQRYRNSILVAVWMFPTLAILGVVSAGRGLIIEARKNPSFLDDIYSDASVTLDLDNKLSLLGDSLFENYFLFLIGFIILVSIIYRFRNAFKTIKIIYPNGKVAWITKSTSILEASRENGIRHVSVCGGRGRCSTCRVRVTSDLSKLPGRTEVEKSVAQRLNLPDDIRLGCQLRPNNSIEVRPLVNMPISELKTKQQRTLSGHEEEIVVMFVDLRDFTRISEKLLPYDTVYLLNQYFEIAGKAITSTGGRIDKFIGDGIMALFLDGKSSQENSKNALLAAGKLADKMTALSKESEFDFGESLKLGIGIHAGSSVVGAMGYEANVNITAIGDCVNVASRLEQLTKTEKCQLIVSEDLYLSSRLQSSPDIRKSVQIKGKAKEMLIVGFKDAKVII